MKTMVTAHEFLKLQDDSKVLKITDDTFMTMEGTMVDSNQEPIDNPQLPEAMVAYEIISVDVDVPRDHIDIYQDEVSGPLYVRYQNSANCEELFHKDLKVNHLRFFTYPRTMELVQDPITEMKRFQTDRNLDKMEFDNLNETTMLLEEIFEGFGFDTPKNNRARLKEEFQKWMTTLYRKQVILSDASKLTEDGEVRWEELVDSTCDMIEISIGKLLKLKAVPELSLLEMAKEINSRKGTIIEGKFVKFKEGELGYEPTYTADYSTCKL